MIPVAVRGAGTGSHTAWSLIGELASLRAAAGGGFTDPFSEPILAATIQMS